MKKIFFSLLTLCLLLPFAGAVPADPTPYNYIQPDGSVIVLQNHGDEFFHWTTDLLGRVVEKDADGFYRPNGMTSQAMAAKARQNRPEMEDGWSSYEQPYPTNFGNRKVLCIIANFTDSTFIVNNPKQHFTNMLNQEGYSFNGAIGSVKDYYVENSGGQYVPSFDVYGPVKLAHPSSYYAANNYALVPDAILEAYELLKNDIPIDDYDTDGDGAIDMVLFYYPGHNPAEGASAGSIWPHQRSGYFGMMGSKRFNRYFCTSELRGRDGTEPASIGTTCHEFAHSLGLPDFYDTDYEGSGGMNQTTQQFDLMTSGSYNDYGRRPPYMSALERNMLGWEPYPETIASSGAYTLEPVQNNKAYQFSTSVPGEYFILESRNGQGWDSGIGATGLLIYHVDKSDRIVTGMTTAAQLWEGNSINAYYPHPCYYLLRANPEIYYGYSGAYVFPGVGGITSIELQDWNGNTSGLTLSNIAHDGTNSSFSATIYDGFLAVGVVKDASGQPIVGAEVALTPSVAPFNAAPSLISTSVSCLTDANGKYELPLEKGFNPNQILTVTKQGYLPVSVNLTINTPVQTTDFVLPSLFEPNPKSLYKFDASLPLYEWTMGTYPLAMGMHYTADELSALGQVGALVKDITFVSSASQGEKVYVVVDIPGVVYLCKDVTAQYQSGAWITVDISNENIIIPEGKDIFIGYGLENIPSLSGYYPIPAFSYTEETAGSYRRYNFLDPETNWVLFTASNGYHVGFPVSATLTKSYDVDFAALGISYIKVVNETPTVVVAAGKSLRSTEWFVDGVAVPTPPAISELGSGSHTYMVRLSYYNGTTERVYYDVDVQ